MSLVKSSPHSPAKSSPLRQSTTPRNATRGDEDPVDPVEEEEEEPPEIPTPTKSRSRTSKRGETTEAFLALRPGSDPSALTLADDSSIAPPAYSSEGSYRRRTKRDTARRERVPIRSKRDLARREEIWTGDAASDVSEHHVVFTWTLNAIDPEDLARLAKDSRDFPSRYGRRTDRLSPGRNARGGGGRADGGR